jgi:hypothetical protein
MAKKADPALVARRIDDVLRIRLDGAEWWDVRDFVREKEKEEGSAWFVPEDGAPLSDAQVRRYQLRADRLVQSSHERSRKKLLRRHLAQRRALYAKATTSGELRTALAVLQDEAQLLGLYPQKTARASVEVTGKDGGQIEARVSHVAADLKPYADAIAAYAASAAEAAASGGGGGALPPDRPSQPLDPAQAAPQTGAVSPPR